MEKKSEKKLEKKAENQSLFKDKMDLINGKLNLLKEQERLLLDESKNEKGKKRKLNCNLEKEKRKIKKQKTLSLPYDSDFDFTLKEKKTFSPTALVRVKVGYDFVKVRALMDTVRSQILRASFFIIVLLAKQ